MGTLFSIEHVEKFCFEIGYKLLSKEYLGVKGEIKIMDEEGYLYSSSLDYLNKIYKYGRKGFKRFHKSNRYVIENIIHWLKVNLPKTKFYSGKYTGKNETNLLFICECGNTFKRSFEKVKSGQNTCLVCSKERKDSTRRLSLDEVKLGLLENNILLVEGQTYGNNRKYLQVECIKCGYRWKRIFHSAAGCPKCNFSKGETKIDLFLSSMGVFFEAQKTFKDCRGDKRPLPFDFYLPKYNLLIEYQGEQHYFPVDFASKGREWAENLHKKLMERDSVKKKYCKKKGITLLTISYKKFNKIEEILTDFLKTNGGKK